MLKHYGRLVIISVFTMVLSCGPNSDPIEPKSAKPSLVLGLDDDPGVFLSTSTKQEILKVRGEIAFAMEESLTCSIVFATEAKKKGQTFVLGSLYAPVLTKLEGQGLTMAQSLTEVDAVTLASDRDQMRYTKIDETKDGVKMIAFTLSGLETLVLDKGNGFFARSFSGVLQGPMGYLQLGYCS